MESIMNIQTPFIKHNITSPLRMFLNGSFVDAYLLGIGSVTSRTRPAGVSADYAGENAELIQRVFDGLSFDEVD